MEHSVFRYKGKNENFIRLGHRRYKNRITKSLLPKDTVIESPSIMKSITRLIQEAGFISIFSGILKYDNDKQEEYVRIGRVETKLFETYEVIRVGVPV